MSEFLKPQSPLRKGEAYIYPLTTEDQIIMEDGSRLSGTNFLSFDNDAAIEGTVNPVNADTLGGRLASDYALKSDIDNAGSGVSSWNDLLDKPAILDEIPEVSLEVEGAFLCVINGVPTWQIIPNAEGVEF